jgi:hypothetical protein
VRLEGLGQLKNPMTSSEIEPATFLLVAKYQHLFSIQETVIFMAFFSLYRRIRYSGFNRRRSLFQISYLLTSIRDQFKI